MILTAKVIELIEDETKWPIFCRRYFQMYFRNTKSSYSISNFIEVCSRWSNSPLGHIMPGRRTSDKPLSLPIVVYRRMCAPLGQDDLNFIIASINTLWRHQMETFSALLAICAGNSPVTGEFPTQRPVTRSFDVYFDLCPNERLSKQSWGWWFETLSRSLWRHRNEYREWAACANVLVRYCEAIVKLGNTCVYI